MQKLEVRMKKVGCRYKKINCRSIPNSIDRFLVFLAANTYVLTLKNYY